MRIFREDFSSRISAWNAGSLSSFDEVCAYYYFVAFQTFRLKIWAYPPCDPFLELECLSRLDEFNVCLQRVIPLMSLPRSVSFIDCLACVQSCD